MKLHKELKEKHEKLLTEVSMESDTEMKRRMAEAQSKVQMEMERRCDVQKELSVALERCQKEQETNLKLLKQRAEDQTAMMEMQSEIRELKRKLTAAEQMAEEMQHKTQAWKEFETQVKKLMQKTSVSVNLTCRW